MRMRPTVHHLLVIEWLLVLVSPSLGLALSSSGMSRADFFVSIVSFPSIPLLSFEEDDSIEIPLQFLPFGGCLALKIIVNDKGGNTRLFAYSAIVDLGSPFVTAPDQIQRFAKDESKRFPATEEQYGETLDSMRWGSLANVQIPTNDFANPLEISNLLIGLPGNNVVQDTGGIFIGLMLQDEYRPSFLKQVGYQSFTLDYSQRILTLYKKSIIQPLDPEAMELFDFSTYGDNLHHYGVLCPSFELITSSKSINIPSMDRPVVAVIDSDLTGCVISDSLRDELLDRGYGDALRKLKEFTVKLSTVSGDTLAFTSNPKYWALAAFKLPWFTDDATHPHVIAMGATFLAKNTRITIDPISKRAKIVEVS